MGETRAGQVCRALVQTTGHTAPSFSSPLSSLGFLSYFSTRQDFFVKTPSPHAPCFSSVVTSDFKELETEGTEGLGSIKDPVIELHKSKLRRETRLAGWLRSVSLKSSFAVLSPFIWIDVMEYGNFHSPFLCGRCGSSFIIDKWTLFYRLLKCLMNV